MDPSLAAAVALIGRFSGKSFSRREGRSGFTRGQLAACLALKEHFATTYRGVAELLASHASLRVALGVKGKLPHYTTLQKFSARQGGDIAREAIKRAGIEKRPKPFHGASENHENRTAPEGRFPVPRVLPPLTEACREFRGFTGREKRHVTIARLLKQPALSARRSQERPFYSMRQVAGFFRVSTKTVFKAYRILDQEGILVRKRGSQTSVPPRSLRPRIPVRAVVALPISMPGFHYLPHWRLWFGRVDDELRRHNFVADFIFYGDRTFGFRDTSDPDFAGRVLAHNPDIVLWFECNWGQEQAIQMISDTGVRVVIATNHPLRIPGQHYHFHRRHAAEQCAADWKRAGVRRVKVPCVEGSKISAMLGEVPKILAPAGIQTTETLYTEREPLIPYIRSLGLGADAVFFDDIIWCQTLCAQAPEEMIALFRRTRCALVDAVRLAPDKLEGVCMDMIHHDYTKLARRIVEDLSTGTAFLRDNTVMIDAKWSPLAAARRFAHEF